MSDTKRKRRVFSLPEVLDEVQEEILHDEHEVELTTGDGPGAPDQWRIERMYSAIGFVAGMLYCEGDVNSSALYRISRIDDHEGVLTVYWAEEPLAWEMEPFVEAWESVVATECKENVRHIFDGEELRDD